MPQFDRTEQGYLDQKNNNSKKSRIGTVTDVSPRIDPADNSLSCRVNLRDHPKDVDGVTVSLLGRDVMVAPQVGDTVLVEEINEHGTTEEYAITGYLSTDKLESVRADAGVIRMKRGNLYFEADADGNWMRIAQKNTDVDDAADANALVEIDDSGSSATINITTNGGSVKLGDKDGTFKDIVRKGDAVEVDDGNGNTLTGQVTEGSSDVEST